MDFKTLKQHIKKQITCIYYHDGKIEQETSTLNDVKDYQYIVTKIKNNNEHTINFINYGEYILTISDSSGNIIYENKNLIELKPKIDTEEELLHYEQLTFKDEYISETRKNSIDYLIKKGLQVIDPQKHSTWKRFVKNNYSPMLYNEVIKATIAMLEKINNGMSIYEAEIQVYRDEFNLFGHETNKVDEALKFFIANQEEYDKYYQTQVIDPSKRKIKK